MTRELIVGVDVGGTTMAAVAVDHAAAAARARLAG
jgi:hypothetical protein